MISIYTKPNCPDCTSAKNLLESEDIDYTAYNVLEDQDAMSKLTNMGLRSVPQVFIGNKLIPNGYQGLLRFWREGGLG